jgi:hypothetical protein
MKVLIPTPDSHKAYNMLPHEVLVTLALHHFYQSPTENWSCLTKISVC